VPIVPDTVVATVRNKAEETIKARERLFSFIPSDIRPAVETLRARKANRLHTIPPWLLPVLPFLPLAPVGMHSRRQNVLRVINSRPITVVSLQPRLSLTL
jgi:hypothetical protein